MLKLNCHRSPIPFDDRQETLETHPWLHMPPRPGVVCGHVAVLPPALALHRRVGRSVRHDPPGHVDAAAVGGGITAQARRLGCGTHPIGEASPVSPNTGAAGALSLGKISRKARAVAAVTATVAVMGGGKLYHLGGVMPDHLGGA